VRIAEVLGMSERKVRAVLARHGLSKLAPVDAHGPKHRYEKPQCLIARVRKGARPNYLPRINGRG
jgi:hypothetical protein